MLLTNPSQAPDHRMWKSENNLEPELYLIKKNVYWEGKGGELH